MIHFTLSKQELALATNRVQGAITEKLLSHISIKTIGNKLHMTATDRVLAIYTETPCQIKSEGECTVPAKLFSDVVRELPAGTVEIKQFDQFLVVQTSGKSKFEMKIPLIDHTTWKNPPAIDLKGFVEVPSLKFSYMIEQVQFCVAQDSPRNYGTVGYLHKPESGALRLVGTDGYRLSHCDINFKFPDHFLSNGICLTKRALQELYRMSTEGIEVINLVVDEQQGTLVAQLHTSGDESGSSNEYTLYIRLAAIKFPNYQGVLPKGQSSNVEVSRSYLQGVAKRVLLASDKSKALKLNFSKGSLALSSRTLGSSESTEDIVLEKFDGDDTELAVNGKFLTDIFSTTNSENIGIQFKSKSHESLIIFPSQEPDGCRSLHVLVPIREAN